LNTILKKNLLSCKKQEVVVLDGTKTKEQLTALGEDIFRYFGCRKRFQAFLSRKDIDSFLKLSSNDSL
jgi:hypothetical protein